MKIAKYRFPLLFGIIWILSCSSFSVSELEPTAGILEEDGKTFIIDGKGKKWDVTHAIKKYGFVASKFQFGLGKDTIRPILNPEMWFPGDPGYPALNEAFLMIGVEINGDSRAYPISVMKNREIADETFGNVKVAVAY